jgi:hypothetical protein
MRQPKHQVKFYCALSINVEANLNTNVRNFRADLLKLGLRLVNQAPNQVTWQKSKFQFLQNGKLTRAELFLNGQVRQDAVDFYLEKARQTGLVSKGSHVEVVPGTVVAYSLGPKPDQPDVGITWMLILHK